jgi:hypothetical protein
MEICSWTARAEVSDVGLDQHQISDFLRAFSSRERAVYGPVARVRWGVQGRERGARYARSGHAGRFDKGWGMGIAVDRLCLHGDMLGLSSRPLEGCLFGGTRSQARGSSAC